MTFTDSCTWCGTSAVFHDDEKERYLHLCDDCLGAYQQMKVFNAILAGEFVPGEADAGDN